MAPSLVIVVRMSAEMAGDVREEIFNCSLGSTLSTNAR